MPNLREQIATHVKDHHDEKVNFLKELVRCPSDNPAGDCAPHAQITKEALEGLGFEVEAHPVPQELAKKYNMISATNLIVRHKFAEGPTLALNAHGDVVPPGMGWDSDPYVAQIKEGWMYGRGAAVSKSDIASYAYALKALIDCQAPIKGTIELHITYDEEIGGYLGPHYILSEGLSKPDYAICAAFSYSVITAHNGCLHLEVEIKGQSAHAAMPDTGYDAIAASAKIIDAIYAHKEHLKSRISSYKGIGAPTCIVGLISGGINTNVVADRTCIRIDRRILPDETPEDVENELRSVLHEAADKLEGISVEIERILLARPFVPVTGSDKLASIVCEQASALLGEEIGTSAVPLYTDARLYSEYNIPTVMYGAGPRSLIEANGHRANERLPIETLDIASTVVAYSALELLK